MIYFYEKIVRLKSIFLAIGALIALLLLSSCAMKPQLVGQIQKQVDIKIARDTDEIKISQQATPMMPEVKFTVPINYEVTQFEAINQLKKTKQKPLSLAGFGGAGLGLILFSASPAPDATKYSEKKYNSLSDSRLQTRQIGLVLLLAGLGVGYFGGTETTFFEQPTGKLSATKKKADLQVRDFSAWVQCDNFQKEKIESGFVNDKSEGAFDASEVLDKAITHRPNLPMEVTFGVDLENGIGRSFGLSIEEAVDIISNKAIDWSKSGIDANVKPAPAVNQLDDLAVKAGQDISVKLILENKGNAPMFRAAACFQSDAELFDGSSNKIVLFGKIMPGEKAERTLNLIVPKDARFDMLPLSVKFEEFNGFTPKQTDFILYIDK